MNPLNVLGDDRAVSPAVGVILIIGIVVTVVFALLFFGGGLIVGDEDPRVDARFTVDAVNDTHIELDYAEGDTFTSDNTDRLYVIGTNSTGEPIGGDDEAIDLYDGVRVTETDESELVENTTVIAADRAEEEGIEPGTSMQILWEPANQDGVTLIIDEVVVPDASTLFIVEDQSGEWGGGGTIIVEGDDSE